MAKQRDPVLDSMRGIGIVLMVLGHSGFPGTDYIYLFHMALFFMLSGWFFSLRGGLVHFVRRKLVTLWLPFVAANTVFTVCNNLFLRLNILTADARIAEIPGNSVTAPVSIKDIIGRTVHWCVFDGGTSWAARCGSYRRCSKSHYCTLSWRFAAKAAAWRRYADCAGAAFRRAALGRLAL